jgi:serine protease SohB
MLDTILQFLYELLLFAGKFIIAGFVIAFILALIIKGLKAVSSSVVEMQLEKEGKANLKITDLKKTLEDDVNKISDSVLEDEELRLIAAVEEKVSKKKKKLEKLKFKNDLKLKVAEAEKELEEKIKQEELQLTKTEQNDNVDNKEQTSENTETNKSAADEIKDENKEEKATIQKKCMYVVDFNGSTDANEVKDLRKIVTLLTKVASEGDELLLRLTSPGGVVNGYGLAASQLERVKARKLKLTIAVDEVAASGGYMMACTGDKIIAAPFAYIGSIGVVAEFPNFNRLLKKYDVDYEQVTAGEFKRTMTPLGENTPEAREKFKEELARIHDMFKKHVSKNRPNLDIEKVANGEHWLAQEALELGLVDEIKTSDEYIIENFENFDKIIQVEYKLIAKKKFLSDLRGSMTKFVIELVSKLARNKGI